MVLGRSQPGRVHHMIEEFRRELLTEDATQMVIMAQRWLAVERGLEARIEALAREAADLKAKGQPVTRNKLYELERYRDLLGQLRTETMRYQKWAAAEIASRQKELSRAGIRQTQALIRESYLEAGTAVARYNMLPLEAMEAMVGFARNGSPLFELLFESYPESVDQLTETLIDATARGVNPRQTASRMAKDMAGNLERALRIARTEQLRAYRRASTEQMRQSGVIEGWIWRSALQPTTCLACLAMDGT